jgi:hypothetical protein
MRQLESVVQLQTMGISVEKATLASFFLESTFYGVFPDYLLC